MAEGMAMIAVELVLEKLVSLIALETQLLRGVRRAIEELQDDLLSMKSFLQVAEARSVADQGLKTWVTQVRDVAYDAEDVLGEFMFHFTPSYRQDFIQPLRSCYHFIRKLRARHQLAVKIKDIKARVKAISDRRNAFSFNMATSFSTTPARWHDPRQDSLYLDEADVVGIENPKSQLVEWLVEGDAKLTFISVVGMGGLGKTTLAKKVYDSQQIQKSFDSHSWVTVSKSYTLLELLRAALHGFLEATKEPAPERIDSMTDLQLVEALRKHLHRKRYVIVLDDIWSIDAWEDIKYAFPDCKCGSRVIFTTRLSNLADSIENASHVYHLQPLPEKEAWTLFCMKAFRGEQNACTQELEALSRRILKRCEGLPLAIVAIGGLLSKKNGELLEWKKVHDTLATELKSENNLGNLGRILLLSYDDLPYYLKQCYLYLSVFPEDYLIKRMKLVRLWVIEKFVEEKHGYTMEEVAEGYLNELVSRSMIQVVKMDHFNRVRTCRVHDLMREIIQTKSTEESLVMIMKGTSNCTKGKVRRLSIQDNCSSRVFSTYTKFSDLRSLLLFVSVDRFVSSGNALFEGFKLLRVLELEGAQLNNFPAELVKLIQLRYLSLKRTMIMELPESIRKLKNLEILDLKHCPISSPLPAGILQLKYLRQIRNYRYNFVSSPFFSDTIGMRVPDGIGRLTSLEILRSIEVQDDHKLVREVGKLTQLRKLGILKLREEHGSDICYTLDKLEHLTALCMVSRDNEVLHLKSVSSPPVHLQRLSLKCSLATLPGWIASLQYLSKLVLQFSNLKSDPLKALQRLPSLVHLELRQAYDGQELCCDGRGYLKLKKLGFYQLKRLQHIRIAEGAMPGLRRLDIGACAKLERVPVGIEHLKNVKDLQLWDMPLNMINSIGRSHGEEFWRVHHIPAITRIYKREGRWATEALS